MLRINHRDGIYYICSACDKAIVDVSEALALWMPLRSEASGEVLIVHRGACEVAPIVGMVCGNVPRKRPLTQALDEADEAMNRG